MSFLTVSGIELGGYIAESRGISEARREIGESTQAFDGTLRKSRQSVKHDLEFETTPMTSATALAWESLIRGLGETWSFAASLYGSKGLGPSSSTGTSLGYADVKFAGGQYLVLAATTGAFILPGVAAAAWTMMAWHALASSPTTWVHWLIDSSGRKWVDGVRNDAATQGWFFTSAGGAVFQSSSGATADRFEEIVVLPYLVPTDWPATFAAATTPFSDLPKLTLAGDAIPEASTRSVMGEATPRMLKCVIGGTLQTNAKVLSVSLSEV